MPSLRYLRNKSGMTALQLAASADVSISTINRMERGKMAVSQRIAYKVLNVLSEKLGYRLEIEDVEDLQVKDE